jgi:hypothetical protein
MKVDDNGLELSLTERPPPQCGTNQTRSGTTDQFFCSVALGPCRCHIVSNYHIYRPRAPRHAAYRDAGSTHWSLSIIRVLQFETSHTISLTRASLFTQYDGIYDTCAHQATVEGRVERRRASGPESAANTARLARVPLASQAQPTSRHVRHTRPWLGRVGRVGSPGRWLGLGLGGLEWEKIVQWGVVGRPAGGRLCDVREPGRLSFSRSRPLYSYDNITLALVPGLRTTRCSRMHPGR